MKNATKKKISFDIDIEDFEKLKAYVSSVKDGQGEVLRQAVKQFLSDFKNDKKLLIYALINNQIKDFFIDKNDFDMKIFTAKERMKEAVGAVKEGQIFSRKKGEKSEIDEYLPLSFYIKIK